MSEREKVVAAGDGGEERTVKETLYSIRVTNDFVKRVETRTGFTKSNWDLLGTKQLCEEIIAEYKSQPTESPETEQAAMPKQVVSDEWLEKLAPGIQMPGRVQSAHMAQELQQWREYGKRMSAK
jgi:hypothetical protein